MWLAHNILNRWILSGRIKTTTLVSEVLLRNARSCAAEINIQRLKGSECQRWTPRQKRKFKNCPFNRATGLKYLNIVQQKYKTIQKIPFKDYIAFKTALQPRRISSSSVLDEEWPIREGARVAIPHHPPNTPLNITIFVTSRTTPRIGPSRRVFFLCSLSGQGSEGSHGRSSVTCQLTASPRDRKTVSFLLFNRAYSLMMYTHVLPTHRMHSKTK